MILLIKDGRRLCWDQKWREMAPFGSMSFCVKVYKRIAMARKIRDSQNALLQYRGKPADIQVIDIPTGYEINAVGQVMQTIPVGDGTEKIEHHPLSKFVVE